jgi:hypothetical protein
MAMLNGRLDRLERHFSAGNDPGRLVMIAPNAWPDADRDAWEASGIRPDGDAQDELIERHSGVRPVRHARYINIIIVPAPDAGANADEATRAAWHETHNARRWIPEQESTR